MNDNLTEKYDDLLKNQIIPEIRTIAEIEFDNVWFHKDGA